MYKIEQDETRAVPIESIACGDTVLGFGKDGTQLEQTVVFVSHHEKQHYEMCEIKLQSGRTVTITPDHMVVVYLDGNYVL